MSGPLDDAEVDRWLAAFKQLFPQDTVPEQLVAELRRARAELAAKETVRAGLERRLSEETARAERAEALNDLAREGWAKDRAAIARVEKLAGTTTPFVIAAEDLRAALRGDHG